MKPKLNLCFCGLICLLLSATSCVSEDTLLPQEPADSGETALSISGDCDYYNLTNTENSDWQIVETPAWITPVAISGTASDKIRLYVESNSQTPRNGEISICYSSGATRSVPVTQSTEQNSVHLNRNKAVGWGLDLTSYKDSRALTDQIFNAQKILAIDPYGVSDEQYTHNDLKISYGSSFEELQSKINADLDIKVKTDAFKLSLEGAFGKETTRQANRAFSWMRQRYDERVIALMADPYEMMENRCFTADFKDMFDKVVASNGSDESIRELISRYGTHYVYQAYLGGYLDYFYSFEHSEMSDDMKIEGVLNAAFSKKFSLDGDVKFEDNLAVLNETAVESFLVRGGDAITLTNLVVTGDMTQKDLSAWLESLNVNDSENAALELIDFKYLPIYDLFQEYDKEKGISDKIRNYINRVLYYNNVPVTRSTEK